MPEPTTKRRARVVLLYHFFHPDDVISARLFTELGVELSRRGWDVVARPCNRVHSRGEAKLPKRDTHLGVEIRRAWRPDGSQASTKGRLLNCMWMIGAWSAAAMFSRRAKSEVVIVGSDPVLGVLAAVPWRWLRRRSRVAHWCFDLYPDAAVVDGMLPESGLVARMMRWFARLGYRACDSLVDIGSCMAGRLAETTGGRDTQTITPWSLVEPATPPAPDPAVRQDLFGDARLGLMYSGSFGRAHSYAEFLELARRLRGDGVGFCFAGRGHRADELKAAVRDDDSNVSFAGFAPEAELEKRLTACDLHLVSLTPEWTGTVVPSKFFGALAAGRGVVFAGAEDSAIAQWIRQHQVGWVVTADNVDQVAAELRELASSPERLVALRQHCHAVYQEHFSRERMIDLWEAELKRLGTRVARLSES